VYQEFPPEELAPDMGVPPGLTQLYLAINPDRYPFGVVGMVGIAGTIMLVNRRRPA